MAEIAGRFWIGEVALLVLSTGTEPVTAVGFSADGWYVYAGTKDGRVIQSDGRESITTLIPVEAEFGTIHSFVESDYSKEWLAVGQRKYASRRFANNLSSEIEFHTFDDAEDSTCWAALTPSILVYGSGSFLNLKPGYLRLFDRNQKRYLGAMVPEKGGVRTLAVSTPTQTVAWSTGDRQIVVWEITKPDRVRMSFQHTSPALAFSPDGLTLAAAREWNVALLDWKQKRERIVIKGHKGRVTAVAYTPDGTLLTASWDGTVRYWDTMGVEFRSLDFQRGRLTSMAIAPDGLRAIVGTDRGTIVIWDLV